MGDNGLIGAYVRRASAAGQLVVQPRMGMARPETMTAIPGLALAGAHCRNHVDLITMESAITSGLHAAEAIRSELGVGAPIVVDVPAPYPQWLLSLARNLLVPVAVVAKLIERIAG